MPEITTISSLVTTWKLLGILYEKYDKWVVGRKRSKEDQRLKAQAEDLMQQINKAILSGSSSDDPMLEPLVSEFNALIENGINPSGSTMTQDWIDLSRKTGNHKPSPKKAAVKKSFTKKAAAKKAVTKKTAARKNAAAQRP